MANQEVQTVGSVVDKLKVALSLLVLFAGVVGFYQLADKPMVVRVGSVLLGFGLAIAIAWFSEPGRRFLAFVKESIQEARRVVWPTRKETLQMSGIVFAFVVVMAIFLWLTDKSLEWFFYDLILGWKK
jgi:preprotein translocase subunit SecE